MRHTVVAAYHAGVQEDAFQTPAYPTDEHRATIKAADAKALLAETEDAIRNNDQGRAWLEKFRADRAAGNRDESLGILG